ncbi:MAG TPA: hypothetical protein PLI61_05690, partial [bacterium]|nr:hypothetical protein [bacterium]
MKVAILVFTLFLISCNSSDPKKDADTAVADKDSAIVTDIEGVDDLSDEALAESDESPDVDTAVECLDLRYNENTLKTGFPFKDKDGKPTFCRPGCDTPTETDPQCVRNIWEWDNWEKYQKYLAAEKEDTNQEWERECYPWPCELPDMKGSTGGSLVSKCDRRLSVNGYRSTMGAVWTHGMSNGVAGMLMNRDAVEYDPEKDVFTKIGQAAGRVSYNKSRYVFPVYDRPYDKEGYRSFVVSVEKKNG